MKRARLDDRTRKIGAPSERVREESTKSRHPLAPAGTHPQIRTVNIFVETSAVPGRITSEEIMNAIRGVVRNLDDNPIYVAPRLATCVRIEGPRIGGKPVIIEESNEHEWVPNHKWEPREMYYGEMVIVDTNRHDVADPLIKARILQTTLDLIDRADADHDDNRWIYITGIWLQVGYRRKK